MPRSWTGRIQDVVRARRQLHGAATTKQAVWDREYMAGRWEAWHDTPGDAVYAYIAKYCQRGSILDLGCGAGNTGTELPLDAYRAYTGVDVSRVAVERARARSERSGRAARNGYVQSDIVTYVPERRHDVIVFRESLYYIPLGRIGGTLERYAGWLTASGVFVVTLFSRRIHARIVDLIERVGTVMEEDRPPHSDRLVIVFRMNEQVVTGDAS